MVRRFLSFLLSKLGVVLTPTAANSGFISTSLTFDINGSGKTFEFNGGTMLKSSNKMARVDLSQADLENLVQLSQRADIRNKVLTSSHPITFSQFRGDGKEQAFDTGEGISNDTKQEMAQQLGITVSELDTLLKIERQALGQVIGNGIQIPMSNDQPRANTAVKSGEKRQLVVCPRCARQIPPAERCLYCGEQVEGKTAPPIE